MRVPTPDASLRRASALAPLHGPPTLGASDHRAFCAVLGLEPIETLHPWKRAAQVPAWVSAPLFATEAARGRARAWAAAGGLDQPDTVEARREVIAQITIIGSDALEEIARRALEALPLCVLDHLRRHAVLLVVGRSNAGFAALEPDVAADAVEQRRLLVCAWQGVPGEAADAAFAGTALHEFAHGWLLEAPLREAVKAPPTAVEAEQKREHRALVVRLGVEWGLLSRLTRDAERDERQACALAALWGATGSAADGALCARSPRERLEREIAALRVQGTEHTSASKRLWAVSDGGSSIA